LEQAAGYGLNIKRHNCHCEESFDIAQDKLRDEETTTSCHLERKREI